MNSALHTSSQTLHRPKIGSSGSYGWLYSSTAYLLRKSIDDSNDSYPACSASLQIFKKSSRLRVIKGLQENPSQKNIDSLAEIISKSKDNDILETSLLVSANLLARKSTLPDLNWQVLKSAIKKQASGELEDKPVKSIQKLSHRIFLRYSTLEDIWRLANRAAGSADIREARCSIDLLGTIPHPEAKLALVRLLQHQLVHPCLYQLIGDKLGKSVDKNVRTEAKLLYRQLILKNFMKGLFDRSFRHDQTMRKQIIKKIVRSQ